MMKLLTIIIAAMMMNTCNGQKTEPMVRPATQANRFYTGDAKELSEEVDSLLAQHAKDKQYAELAAVMRGLQASQGMWQRQLICRYQLIRCINGFSCWGQVTTNGSTGLR